MSKIQAKNILHLGLLSPIRQGGVSIGRQGRKQNFEALQAQNKSPNYRPNGCTKRQGVHTR